MAEIYPPKAEVTSSNLVGRATSVQNWERQNPPFSRSKYDDCAPESDLMITSYTIDVRRPVELSQIRRALSPRPRHLSDDGGEVGQADESATIVATKHARVVAIVGEADWSRTWSIRRKGRDMGA
jgi:hypothetical protein